MTLCKTTNCIGKRVVSALARCRPRRTSPSVIIFLVLFVMLASTTWRAGRTTGDSASLFLVVAMTAAYIIFSRLLFIFRDRDKRALIWQDMVEMTVTVLLVTGTLRYDAVLADAVEERLLRRSLANGLVAETARFVVTEHSPDRTTLARGTWPKSVEMLRPLHVEKRFGCMWILRRGQMRGDRKRWVIVCPEDGLSKAAKDYLDAMEYGVKSLDEHGVYLTVDVRYGAEE